MLDKILLSVSDRQCAEAALRMLQELSECPTVEPSEVIVLGVVKPFRTVYAHKHPLTGRWIRHLLRQVNRTREEEVECVVGETAAQLEALGWQVRAEIRQGDIAHEILGRCRVMSPQLLVIGSCLRTFLPLFSSGEIWPLVVREATCPVWVIKHSELARSPIDNRAEDGGASDPFEQVQHETAGLEAASRRITSRRGLGTLE